MKKILFVLVAVLSALTVSAKDDVTVTSGSLAELAKAAPAEVAIVWDYSNATIEGKNVDEFLKEKGEDWVNRYPSELKNAEEQFSKQIAKASKFFKVVDQSQAKYIITVKAGDFLYGSVGLSVVVGFGSGDAHFRGNIEITRQGESSPVAVLNVEGVPGKGYGNEARRTDSYKRMAAWVVKYTKKAK